MSQIMRQDMRFNDVIVTPHVPKACHAIRQCDNESAKEKYETDQMPSVHLEKRVIFL